MTPTTIELLPLLQLTSMTSWGVPSDQMTEEKEIQAQFTHDSLWYTAKMEVNCCMIMAKLRGVLIDSKEMKYFHWAELQAVYLLAHCVWKERWPEIQITWAVASARYWIFRDLEDTILED